MPLMIQRPAMAVRGGTFTADFSSDDLATNWQAINTGEFGWQTGETWSIENSALQELSNNGTGY